MGSNIPRWDKQKVVAAIKKWYDLYGDIPTINEWNSSRRPDWCPCTATVRLHFKDEGGWAAAIKAAGFTPRVAGVNGHLVYPEWGPRGVIPTTH